VECLVPLDLFSHATFVQNILAFKNCIDYFCRSNIFHKCLAETDVEKRKLDTDWTPLGTQEQTELETGSVH
jgi:hypothetical protein